MLFIVCLMKKKWYIKHHLIFQSTIWNFTLLSVNFFSSLYHNLCKSCSMNTLWLENLCKSYSMNTLWLEKKIRQKKKEVTLNAFLNPNQMVGRERTMPKIPRYRNGVDLKPESYLITCIWREKVSLHLYRKSLQITS